MSKAVKRWILSGMACFACFNVHAQIIAPAPYPSDMPVNFIRTWDATSPQTNPDTLVRKSLKDVKIATQYFDGLGNPIQTVMKQGSLITGGSAVDFVSPALYDDFGREIYKYLPFAANNTGGNTRISDGLFKFNPFQQDSAFNKNIFPNENYIYSQAFFENSPLNRVLEQFAAGNSWAGTTAQGNEADRHSVKTKYWVNTTTDSVRIWTVTDVTNCFGTYASSATYAAGELFKNVTADEHNKQVIEFKDKGGKVIMKKVQLTAGNDNGTGKGYYGWLSTYYIYDEFGQLRAVVQPTGVELLLANSWSFTSDILKEQTFRYEYDGRGRMIMKQVPGAGTVYMIYDARDRLVMTQDSLMRADHKWLYTLYDNNHNRPVVTGLITDNTYYNNAAYHRGQAESSTSYPNTGSYTDDILTKIFYDDYSWRSSEGYVLSETRSTTDDNYLLTASNTVWPYAQDATEQTKQLKGMVTGTKVKILETSSYLHSVTFYDEKGRTVQTQSYNYTGGADIVSTQYSWSSQPLLTINRQQKNGTNTQTTIALTKLTYDDLFRVIKVEKRVSNTKVNGGSMPGSWKTIVTNEYDALGQLKKKKLGSTVDSLTYDYNIRGWMLGANRTYVKDTTSTANWFGFDLGYDDQDFTVNGSSKSYATEMFNGNIAGMLWRSAGDDMLRKYDFTYDAANRFLSADFNQLNSNSFSKAAGIDFSVSGMSYDANGNILKMNQKGWKLGGSVTIDSLHYTYVSNSNKLLKVIDAVSDANTKLGDFNDGTNGSNNDYAYDGNGNMIQDLNKDIDWIGYNILNLPSCISVVNKGSICYKFDALGNKLRKEVYPGAQPPGKNTFYFGNVVFYEDTLQFISHEEGRIRFRPSDSSLHYDYFIKDHLGNVRMVLTEEQQTDAYPAASMETAQSEIENTFYSNIDNTREALPNGYPYDDYTDPNEYVARVGVETSIIGPGIVLKVMAGDKFNLRVSSWYGEEQQQQYSGADMATAILENFSSGIENITGGKFTAGDLQGNTPFITAISNFLSNQGNGNTSLPKAFVNWILLDEQFNIVLASSGFEQVGQDNTLNIHIFNDMPVNKNGYLYIFVSNENRAPIDVFFDNLQVTHIRGPLISEDHYYPFGLTMAGISSKALNFGSPENKSKFNGYEQQSKEFSDFSLEWYDYKNRFYDNQIGRFFVRDRLADEYVYYTPYQFAGNEVPNAIDLDGLEPWNPIVNHLVTKTAQNPNSKEATVLGVMAGIGSFAIKVAKAPYELVTNPPRLDPIGAAENGANLAVGVSERIDKIENGTIFEKTAAITETVLDAAGLVSGARGAVGATTSKATLYRGVNQSNVGFSNALNGKAVPKGGNATPIEHNLGNTNSPYTSWTTNPEVAKNYALRPAGKGVVLSTTVSKNKTVASPSTKNVQLKQTPEKVVNESEVLIKGKVTGAKTTIVSN